MSGSMRVFLLVFASLVLLGSSAQGASNPVYLIENPELETQLGALRTGGGADEVRKAFDAVTSRPHLRASGDIRFLAGAGALVDVYCFRESTDSCLFKFDEKARRSRISEDLTTLMQGVLGAGGAGAALADQPTVELDWTTYRLVEDRGTLEVSAGELEDEDAISTSGTPVEGEPRLTIVVNLVNAAAPKIVKVKVLTGSAEHMFLSADIPVNKAKVLKFDSDTGTLVEREEPAEFHLGVNYSRGDMASSPRSFGDAVFYKLMLHPSSEPLSSFGVGLGLRGKKLDWIDLAPLTFFVAYTWTESDELDANGDPKPDDGYEGDFRFGVGFNLSKALDWLN